MFFYNAFRALAFNGIAGDYAEFGCWSGATFAMAHMESRRRGHSAHLWAFDSFQGLPPQRDPEDDNMAADDSPRDIALAYVDCDLYSSTMSVMRFLMPRLKHGMIIAFDDYFC